MVQGHSVRVVASVERMRVFGIDDANSYRWQDLNQDPCYWDDFYLGRHRTMVFNDGQIQIFQLANGTVSGNAILDLPGK